jgi:Fic family protein
MAEYIERLWNPVDETAGLGRRDRKPGRYLAYIPDELKANLPQLSTEANEAAADALAVLARADERIGASGKYLNHLLIRSESISSSWIEGNRITPKKLAIAETLGQGGRVALDVVANVRATEEAISKLSDPARDITTADIVALQHVIEPSLSPGLRTEQNWVGGAGWSPLRADFIPPPETEVAQLVENLAQFLTATHGNPIVRAAIAHAQFETIHPFTDGNGRTGRALIHTVLKRADAVRNTLIPISTVFAGNTDAYIGGLTQYRAIPTQLDDWIIAFAQATELAAANAVRLSESISRVDTEERERLTAYRTSHGKTPSIPRANAVIWKILDLLPQEPVLTTQHIVKRLGCSPTAAHLALTELNEAGILGRTKDQKGKLVCWTADHYLSLVALTERSNRVGGGDTFGNPPRLGPPRPEL